MKIKYDMEQYIKKSDIIAEIERRIKECDKLASAAADNNLHNTLEANELLIRQYTSLLHFLGTLEVKEVDLEKEIQQHINDCLDIKFPTTNLKMIAKDVEYTARKFFELGLKACKE